MIKPWIFEFFYALDPALEDADPANAAAHFDKYLNMWERTEAQGFEGIFFSEHHFGPGFSPSPHLMIAAMASRTKTLRLGSLGAVAGYYYPWKIVEEFSMLNLLTHGRLEIGLVRGIPPEMAAVGISLDVANQRFDEAMALIDKSIEQKPMLKHKSDDWDFDVRLVPSMNQQTTPAKWAAVVHTESAERAATRGWKICLAFEASADLRPTAEAYLNAASKAGRKSGPDDLAVRRRVIFVESNNDIDAAREVGKDAQREVVLASARLQPGVSIPDVEGRIRNRQFSDEEFIVGTPDDVAEQIIDQCRTIGCGNFLANFYEIPEMDGSSRLRELFAKHVIPQMRKAEIN